MRKAGGTATLNEMMGKGGQGVSLDDLPELLGEKMPEMEHDEVGRFRLIRALRNRFGEGYRNLPGIKQIIGQFEKSMRLKSLVRLNKESSSGET